jgi:thioredoxin 1
MSIVHVSDDTFEAKVLQASRPVLVDFWAEWCGPCKAIAPILDQIAIDFQDRIDIAKVDVEGSQSTAMKYGIRSIPTLMLFRDGREVARQAGAMDAASLRRWLAANGVA